MRSEATKLDVRLRARGFSLRDGSVARQEPWNLRLERRRIDNKWSQLSYTTERSEGEGKYRIRNTGKFYDLSIGRYHSREPRSGPYRQYSVRRIAMGIAAALEGEAEQMVLLGPVRTAARRFYLLTGERPEDVGLGGERSVELLWMARRTRSRVGEFLGRWLKAFDISLNIKLRRLARTSFLAVELVDPMTGAVVQLADVGVGASQVLPILVGGYLSSPGSTLVIEQPELHLHPAAQGEIADALVELMMSGRQVVLETHSEHLVRRIQRRIAEGSVDKDDVALYYVDRREEGSVVLPIPLDMKGSFLPESLPEGFFDVDFRETEAITSAWRAKRNG